MCRAASSPGDLRIAGVGRTLRPEVRTDFFADGTQPEEECSRHLLAGGDADFRHWQVTVYRLVNA